MRRTSSGCYTLPSGPIPSDALAPTTADHQWFAGRTATCLSTILETLAPRLRVAASPKAHIISGGAWVVSYSNLLVRDALALCEHPQSTLVIPSEDLASGQFTQSQGYPIVRTRPSHDTDLREARELHGQLKNIVLLFIDIEGVQGCGAQAHLGHPLSMRLDGCYATYLCGRKDSI